MTEEGGFAFGRGTSLVYLLRRRFKGFYHAFVPFFPTMVLLSTLFRGEGMLLVYFDFCAI